MLPRVHEGDAEAGPGQSKALAFKGSFPGDGEGGGCGGEGTSWPGGGTG